MGMFDSIRNKLKDEPRVATEWDSLSQNETVRPTEELAETKSRLRQESKLIQALLPGNGKPDVSKIAGDPNNLGPHDKNIVLAKISQGLVGRKDFETVIDGIKGPLSDNYGEFNEKAAVTALDHMAEDNHQLKILAFANGYDANEHFKETDIDDVALAFSTFKNPMQFEARMEPFMRFLAEHNSPKKVDEYRKALRDVEKNLFGKKFDYFERSKELIAEAQNTFGMPEKSPLELDISEVPIPDKASREKINIPDSFLQPEQEKTSERLVKDGGSYQISRAQARNGERANMGEKLPYDDSCEDSSIVDFENGFFGVFDGAGGHENGRLASNIGVKTMADMMARNGDPTSPNMLADWLDEANRRIRDSGAGGYSTGIVAKVLPREDGGKRVIWANVGDSRLYIVHKDGRAELISRDEGEGKYLTNALGNSVDAVCRQASFRDLYDGDRLVLCSDGITGDVGSDLMSEAEVGYLATSTDAKMAAQALVHGARKRDDRTAIVAEV